MTATTYELRTTRGARALAFDNEQRAREERKKAELRIGAKLELWRVRTIEERVS